MSFEIEAIDKLVFNLNEMRYQRDELLTAAKLVLLFHSSARWTDASERHWQRVTGNADATTKSLCDHIRAVIARVEETQ